MAERWSDYVPPKSKESWLECNPKRFRPYMAHPPFKDAMELLTMISLVRGKLGKVSSGTFAFYKDPSYDEFMQGGKPDIMSAALSVVHDWNVGKIPFFTIPPAVHPSMTSKDLEQSMGTVRAHKDDNNADVAQIEAGFTSTSIVSAWSKPFDLEGLWDAADEDVLGDDGDGEMQVEEGDIEVSGFVPDEDDVLDG